ncbi:diguanylate cyclase [Gilvimarinus agarilyticus]|uniref:sensor domain-containing diguanylate cyclase n=1 Tax=Gilvimarinus sp. 2_MG-2023 TaxID=3062666 RepID=UPI001C0870C7|nr:diguanylate cyclase [Gilvimarinus sp. 2_MG-2023]MBU2887069.1 diguanylate cyclase [Gilvimarinus agarilyticus]MDO6571728.1 diguanylate cyclase [Gilvimarinus sp. 2_MG-2023]
MSQDTELSHFLKDVHWLMDILQNIDVGLVVLDQNYEISLWNQFMQNHSGKAPEIVLNQTLFSVFPELSEDWFRRKAEPAFILKSATFTTWEQRPYLFHFPHYRPITGTARFMYQNTTIIPLMNTNGQVSHICLIVYDVTDSAMNKLAQIEANNRLEGLSRIDHLTQLYNRGYWEQCLEKEFKRFDRYQIPASLIMFDIDHFKSVNDTYGHIAGDDVIRMVSATLRSQLRDTDLAGRYGGEEFGVVLTNTDTAGAVELTERLRKQIENQMVVFGEQEIKITVSLGICELNETIDSYQQWLESADKALYYCKEHGRNQSYSLPQTP